MKTKHKITYETLLFPEEVGSCSHEETRRLARDYGKAAGLSDAAVSWEESGRPVFSSGEAYLSVTHTGPFYAVAFAPFPVGVDAEELTRENPRVAGAYFDPEERKAPFAAVWTAKEAVAKITGAGLSALREIRVRGNRAFRGSRRFSLFYETVAGKYLVAFAREEFPEEV